MVVVWCSREQVSISNIDIMDKLVMVKLMWFRSVLIEVCNSRRAQLYGDIIKNTLLMISTFFFVET